MPFQTGSAGPPDYPTGMWDISLVDKARKT